MLSKNKLEFIINYALQKGADFAEVFVEKTKKKNIKFSDSKIDNIKNDNLSGIGIRLACDNETYYAYTSDLKLKNILNLIDNINITHPKKMSPINLRRLKRYHDPVEISHSTYLKKGELCHKLNTIARNYSSLVSQVEINFLEYDQEVTIASSDKNYIKDNRILTRLYLYVYVKDDKNMESSYYAPGAKKGYEFLNELNLEEKMKELVDSAILKLNAVPCPGGVMPVVIGNGFGGVIFHEACGHGLEATSVAENISVFSKDLGKKIASDVVTLIDDGSIPGFWGSSNVDDEGNVTQKNVLIEQGVLKKFLIDKLNNRIMNQEISSSGRRENYKYAPTSRMSNTYLEKGTDKISDMIKSIEYGLYAKSMGGGSVNPNTGDFNFSVKDAFLIEKGQITKAVKGASLIGNSVDILKEVSMVSDDLELETGYCGSISGSVPTTVGQPTIKVDHILVGGVK